MTEEKKKFTATKSLETAREAGKFGKRMYARGVEAAAEGKAVIYSMALHAVSDILAAMDVAAVYPENYGTLCAAKRVNIPYMEYFQADGFADFICSYFTNSIGCVRKTVEAGWLPPPEAPAGGLPKPTLILCVRRPRLCDVGVISQIAFKRYFDAPTYCMDLPLPPAHANHEEMKESYIRYVVRQLKEFTEVLEKLTGKKLDMDRLSECVELSTETRRLWHECHMLRKAIPCPMSSQDVWSCMIPFYWMASEKETVVFYQKLYDEIKYRVDNKIGAISDEKCRVIFSEGAIYHTLEFFDYLANLGMICVAEGHWYRPGWHPEMIAGITDPYERIAHTYYMDHWPYVLKAKGETGDWMAQRYLGWIRDYNCVGALLFLVTSCHGALYQLMHIRNVLLEHKIPSLVFEGDMCDPRTMNIDDLKKRVDTFVEIMEAYKKMREQE